MRSRTLETVESLASTPHTRHKNSRLWGKVAAGRSWRSASNSLLTPSSSLGLEPGRFFGASDLPWRAAATWRLTEEMPTPKVRERRAARRRVAKPRGCEATRLRSHAVAAPRAHVERCEVEGRTLYLLAGGGAVQPGSRLWGPYDTSDLVTAPMLEATGFPATGGVQYPPGVHLLPKKVQDRAAKHFLDET
jgi:hypothetical protein